MPQETNSVWYGSRDSCQMAFRESFKFPLFLATNVKKVWVQKMELGHDPRPLHGNSHKYHRKLSYNMYLIQVFSYIQ